MVQQAWDLNSNGSRAKQLRNKILSVRRKAMEWNKNVFRKFESEIKLKQAHLQHIQISINSLEDVKGEWTLRNELEDLLNREELM